MPVGRLGEAEVAAEPDPLGELMKTLFYVYKSPVEVPWEATAPPLVLSNPGILRVVFSLRVGIVEVRSSSSSTVGVVI